MTRLCAAPPELLKDMAVRSLNYIISVGAIPALHREMLVSSSPVVV